MSHLKTRFVVPLLPAQTFIDPVRHLNPILVVGGETMVLGTQFAFTIPLSELGSFVCMVDDDDHRIITALDTLIGTA